MRALLKRRHPKLQETPVGGTVCWYLEPEVTTYQPSTHTGHHESDRGDAASVETWNRLARAVERGGYRAVKTWMPDTERAAHALRSMPGVVPFDVSAEFVHVVDEVMDGMGSALNWDILSEADNSRPGDRVRAAGADAPTGDGVVLLHRATPPARYEPGRAQFGTLVQEAREANRSPYGLWLLCPMRGPQAAAALDSRPAGIIAESEQVLLPRGFSAPEAVLVG